MDYFQPSRMAIVWTTASTQVAVELRKRLFGPPTHEHAMPTGPIDEMFGCSKVHLSSNRGIARLRQSSSKALKQGPSRTTSKCLNAPARFEEL